MLTTALIGACIRDSFKKRIFIMIDQVFGLYRSLGPFWICTIDSIPSLSSSFRYDSQILCHYGMNQLVFLPDFV